MGRPAHELGYEEHSWTECPAATTKGGLLGLAEKAGAAAYHAAVGCMRIGKDPMDVDAAFAEWSNATLDAIHMPWRSDASEAFHDAWQDESLEYEDVHCVLWLMHGKTMSAID